MASSFVLPADKVAGSALGLLLRELVIAGTITPYTDDNFKGTLNHTLTVPIRARATARNFAIDAASPARQIVVDDLTESSVGIKLDTVVYHATGLTDEQVTLQLTSFQEQILSPQAIAVAEYIESLVFSKMTGAKYGTANKVAWVDGTDSAFKVAAECRAQLNRANVPAAGRYLLVGPEAEVRILSDQRLDSANPEGLGQGALRDATIGRLAGFTVVSSNLVPDDKMYAYHKTAFAYANIAPVVPQGARTGKQISQDGFSIRWIADYDADLGTDRSVVTSYAGAASIEDGPSQAADTDSGAPALDETNVRAVEVTLS